MVESGLWYEEGRAWYAREERGRYVPGVTGTINSAEAKPENSVSMIDRLKATLSGVKETAQGAFTRMKNGIRSTFRSITNGIASFFDRSSKQEQPHASENHDTQNNYMTVPGGDSLSFYQKIMTPETATGYSYEVNQEYMCNTYVRDMILAEYGRETYDLIFQGRSENTNAMFESFKNNPNLEKLDPNVYSIQTIQNMADTGTLILMIYQNRTPGESGHIAFVGNSSLKLFTVPAIARLEGRTGRQVIDADQLILVQAGSFAGNTTINYGTNGWRNKEERGRLLKDDLYFYALKKR
jgi:hypothetical protein